MEKMVHYVITVSNEDRTKFWSAAFSESSNQNIVSIIKRYKNIVTLNVCDTKKKSIEIAEYWNECYKRNGTYYFN